MATKEEEMTMQQQNLPTEVLTETAPDAGAGEAAGAEAGQVPSDYEYLKSRTGKRHPDMQFADDEAYNKQMRLDADEDDKRMADYEKSRKEMSDLFASDPRSAEWFNLWKKNKGKSPIAAMIRIYGTDMLRDGLDDPNLADQLEEAEKDYLDMVTESKNYGEQVQKNLDATLDMAEKYAKDNNMTDEQVDQLLDKVFERFKRINLGEITAEDLDFVRKAEGFDQAVEEAKAEGETIGRNQKIRETLKKANSSDGIASLSGTATRASKPGAMIVQNDQDAYQRGSKASSEAPEVRARQRYR